MFEHHLRPDEITPDALRRYLQMMSDGFRSFGSKNGGWIMPQFVLEAGIDCVAQPLPDYFTKRTPKHCFSNARTLVRRAKGLMYCEGFVLARMVPFPVHHAWAINIDREVIDPTLRNPETSAYIGVPFSAEEVLFWSQPKSASLMLNHVDIINVAMMRTKHPPFAALYREELAD